MFKVLALLQKVFSRFQAEERDVFLDNAWEIASTFMLCRRGLRRKEKVLVGLDLP